MISRDAIGEAAVKYEGVRFRIRGRDRSGIDCVGLLVAAGRDAGLPIIDTDKQYVRTPDVELFKQMIRDQSRKGDRNSIQTGSILMFRQGVTPCHCGLAIMHDGVAEVIHASLEYRKVLREPLSKFYDLIIDVREYYGVI